MGLQESATKLLLLIEEARKRTPDHPEIDAGTLQMFSGLPIHEVNDSIALLERAGFVEWRRYLGTGPFNFGQVWITPIGRYEAERISGSMFSDPESLQQVPPDASRGQVSLPPAPIGSPYGFRDEDWEVIAERKSQADRLNVVMGCQFESTHYDTATLQENVEASFKRAVSEYNSQPGSFKTTLAFKSLAAGYGEHLFNEIARDIIASDIAVFETSDLNPNVMLELGVALTWGTRVVPIKIASCPKPPSDVSGQTWIDYEEDAQRFLDTDHQQKLARMVERAMRKKGRR